jgi:hypothetical protein
MERRLLAPAKNSDGDPSYRNQHILRTGAGIRSGASLVRKAADSCKCLKTIAGMSGTVRDRTVPVSDSNQRREASAILSVTETL